MKKFTTFLLFVVIIVGVYAFMMYNRLVSASENVDAQWAQVEGQYQRRFDLIPNLVESVKGIMEQEQEVFGALAEARTRYSGASGVSERAEAATQVESAFGRLLVVMENYPQLTATANFRDLQAQLEGTENRITVARKDFNEAVQAYNTAVMQLPGSLIAGMFGFDEKGYFTAEDGADQAPDVNF